jgi:hypothetical protein
MINFDPLANARPRERTSWETHYLYSKLESRTSLAGIFLNSKGLSYPDELWTILPLPFGIAGPSLRRAEAATAAQAG